MNVKKVVSFAFIPFFLILVGIMNVSYLSAEKNSNFISGFTLDEALACTYDEMVGGECDEIDEYGEGSYTCPESGIVLYRCDWSSGGCDVSYQDTCD